MDKFKVIYTREYVVSAISEDDAINQVEEQINDELSRGDFLASDGSYDVRIDTHEDEFGENTSEGLMTFDVFINKTK